MPCPRSPPELPCRLKDAMISFAVRCVLPKGEEAGSMPQVEVDGLSINYDVQGRASRFCLSRTRPRTTRAMRFSPRHIPSISAASRLTFPAQPVDASGPGRRGARP